MSIIVITINGVEKYPSLYAQVMKQLEDKLSDVILEKGFDDFTIENSYTGNSIRKMPKTEGGA